MLIKKNWIDQFQDYNLLLINTSSCWYNIALHFTALFVHYFSSRGQQCYFFGGGRHISPPHLEKDSLPRTKSVTAARMLTDVRMCVASGEGWRSSRLTAARGGVGEGGEGGEEERRRGRTRRGMVMRMRRKRRSLQFQLHLGTFTQYKGQIPHSTSALYTPFLSK